MSVWGTLLRSTDIDQMTSLLSSTILTISKSDVAAAAASAPSASDGSARDVVKTEKESEVDLETEDKDIIDDDANYLTMPMQDLYSLEEGEADVGGVFSAKVDNLLQAVVVRDSLQEELTRRPVLQFYTTQHLL